MCVFFYVCLPDLDQKEGSDTHDHGRLLIGYIISIVGSLVLRYVTFKFFDSFPNKCENLRKNYQNLLPRSKSNPLPSCIFCLELSTCSYLTDTRLFVIFLKVANKTNFSCETRLIYYFV